MPQDLEFNPVLAQTHAVRRACVGAMLRSTGLIQGLMLVPAHFQSPMEVPITNTQSASSSSPPITARRITTVFGLATAMLLVCAATVMAQSSFSGTLPSDTTWTLGNSPIQVTGNLMVPAGTTLTIEPGVVVQFGAAKVLQVNGTLVARGTAAAQIRFTSAQVPATAGDWGPVRFTDTSVDAGFDAGGNYISGSILEYVVIEGGGAGPSNQSGSAVDLIEAAPLLKSLTLQNNRGWGVNAWFDPAKPPSTLKILDSEIASRTAGGINIYKPNQIVLVEDNRIHGNYAANEEGIGVRLYSNGVGQGQAVLRRNRITTSGTGIDAATFLSTLQLTDNTLVGNKAGIVVTSGGSSTITLTGNVVQGSWRAGGVRLTGATRYDSGGAIVGPQDTFTVTGNVIIQNEGRQNGAGLYVQNQGPTTVTGNIISDNASTNDSVNYGAGGVYLTFWTPTPTPITFANNLISRNSGLTYGGLYAAVSAPATLDIRNNTITQNQSTLQNRPAVGVTGTTLTVNGNNIFGNIATYAFEYLSGPSFPFLDATNNWWGTSDDAAIRALIYDFEDNGQYAPVTATPELTGIGVAPPVSPPTGLMATPAAGSVTLNWTANPEPDVAGYRVWYGTPGGPPYAGTGANEGPSPITVGNVTTFTLTGLPAGTVAVTVTAYDVGRDGVTDQRDGNESWFAAEPNVPPAPGVPSNPSPADGATNVDTRTFMDLAATWSGAAGAVSYNVAFGTANPPPVQDTGVLATTWRWRSNSYPRLAPSTTYYWWVAATGADGAVSVSPIWSFTTSAGTLPETPHDGRAILVTRTSAELEWSGFFALGFDVEFGATNPPTATVRQNGGTTYGAQGLSPGTTYYWRVTARNEVGTAVGPAWSFTTSALPRIDDDPSPAYQATNVPLGTPLTWRATGATSYDVSLWRTTVDRDPPVVVAATGGLTSASFGPPLSPGTGYTWQVIARNAAGTTTGPLWWFITTGATPAPNATSNVPAVSADGIPATNPVPTLTGLDPPTVLAGSAAFTLRVLGTGFVGGSVVQWDGGDRTTTWVSTTELQTVLAAADVAAIGAHTITAISPTPGGGLSNSAPLTVTAPSAPTISNLTPFDVALGTVTDVTPAPGGGTSNAATLTVTGPTLAVSATQVAPGTPVTVTLTNELGGILPGLDPYSSSETDTDHDGLPDSWEVQFGLDPNSGTGNNGASGDPDGDGFTNLQEYERGSSPVRTQVWPHVLDLNGDRGGDALLYNLSTGAWRFELANRLSTGFTERPSAWDPGWQVYPANLNADEYTDFFLYDPVRGFWAQALNVSGGGTFTYTLGNWDRSWTVVPADLDGDGRTDLFVYNVTTGAWVKCFVDGRGDFAGYNVGNWDPGWTFFTADLNGDGRDDFFLYNRVNGVWVEAFSQGGFGAFDYPAVSRWDPGWQVYPTDLNGDGRTDLFLLNAAGVHVSALSRATGDFDYVAGPRWAPGWSVSSGDLNADGFSDLFLYNPTTGLWVEAFSNGAGDFTYAAGRWDPGWSVRMTDLNEDGRGDLLLDRADGAWVQATNTGTATFTYAVGNWGTGWAIFTRRPSAR